MKMPCSVFHIRKIKIHITFPLVYEHLFILFIFKCNLIYDLKINKQTEKTNTERKRTNEKLTTKYELAKRK